MLRPLLYLSALLALPCVAGQILSVSTMLDISTCPITYFGKTYTHAYVNFTAQNFVVCFDGFYSPPAGGDCLLAPPVTVMPFSIYPYVESVQQTIYENVMTISNTLQCFLYFNNNGGFTVANLGSQTALIFAYFPLNTGVAKILLNGTQVRQITVKNTALTPKNYAYADLSSCRYQDIVYRPSTNILSSPANCTTVTCDASSVLQTSTCGPTQTCLGNNMCVTTTTAPPTTTTLPTTTLPPIVDSMCTVTGPSVIDFHNNVNSVKDRCAYSLLQIPSLPGFQVLANFLERRLTDVSFLDSVTLQLNNNNIHLKQGGRVLLNDTPQDLSSSPQMVGGVMVSKDQTGVTVMVQINNFKITVSFDGYTAQILVDGPGGSSLQGLCANSSSEPRVLESSPMSCQTQYTNTDQSFINFINKTESCNLLKEAPFTSCAIDPEPYITACTDTLSRYPDVDGLKCQFLEAYSKACSLKLNTTVEGWRSKADCPPPEAFCQDRTCSDNEFCGEKSAGGETRCFCRPIFASSYRKINALGDPTVCIQNSASITLVNCLLEDKDIDYSVLHLNDPTCRGQMDEETHLVTFSFNSSGCGAKVTTNNSQIIYENTIMSQNNSSDIIIRQSQVYIKFSCFQTQPDIKTVVFRIKDSSVVQVITSGPWNYTLTMTAYTDAGLTQAVGQSTDVLLNQRIWVELDTKGLDGNELAVVTDSCWATDQPSPTSSPRYDLIKDSCPNPADPTVAVQRNGAGTSNLFSFNMFEFSGGSSELFLYCSLHLCVKQKNSCIPVCNNARRRRSFRSKLESAAFIGISWAH